MEISENAEEILEKLWICSQERGQNFIELESLNLDKESPEVLELLDMDNIDLNSDSKITLKHEGYFNAKNVVRRHRLAERLLVDVLDKKEGVHKSACEFEHILHDGVDDKVCVLLGHPRTCPHGNPIPKGECCKKGEKEVSSIVQPLSELKLNQKGKIAYFEIQDNEKLQKLMSMGILPGMPVTLVQSYPSYVFDLDQTRYAVDKEMADYIFVRVENK
ncbi:iron (metal) dependent repressor, DtxR family [Methanohalobium evestigatum Z-7303]|uniref:Iron (Metal) dependent repressor, DtxR family n=1 Tax=Methanohalobium evestigatum (strain ATCC BAA-1072 / DSM 3721 / NBRC 107634 / OCM 161 / Z-7303) TaxID=644295 RepID=D7EAJ8_METEZ|nr:metal-dependent transcriptional regulator [Methanohalobium evestigatum]ADI74997.1 iron (metal) dependent repressor, DtxR family [Methanohalobium evestigatum Z-7303]